MNNISFYYGKRETFIFHIDLRMDSGVGVISDDWGLKKHCLFQFSIEGCV